jgi:hypothetical protein
MKHMKVREGEAQNPRQFRSLRTGREFEDRCHGETQLDGCGGEMKDLVK